MFNKKTFWTDFLKATIVVLCVALTVCITWGIPQLASWGEPNYPSIPLDSHIPLITQFVWIYYFTFPLGILSIYILYFKNREAMWNVVTAFILSCYVSMLFYFIYPTEMIKPALEPVTFADKFTIATWHASRPVCCLPSQHCFMALSCIIASFFEKKTHWVIRLLTIVCGILIIMSTVFIKQHYFLDFIASLVIIIPIFLTCFFSKWGTSVNNFIISKTTKKSVEE